MTQINVIEAVDTRFALRRRRIEALLAHANPEHVGHDSAFTGRPATVLVADDELVLKKRTELTYRPGDDERWIHRALASERVLGVHHYAKTWLILQEHGRRIIANVTPRLEALDQWIIDADPEPGHKVLEDLLRMYIEAFFKKGFQLDPGLSNFGTDSNGQLYYLDDESSPARGLGSLAAAMATWFRVIPWADDAVGQRLGAYLSTLLLEELDDPHPLHVVQGQLKAQFAANKRQAGAINAAVEMLAPTTLMTLPAPRPKSPPRYVALLADIHANVTALDRALAYVDALASCELWVLGDIVGYGPNPSACIRRLRDRNASVVIKGNHDHAAALGRAGRGFSPLARQLIDWTTAQLSADERAWLMALPPKHESGDWLAVHGAPQDPSYFNAYVYQMTYADNLAHLAERGISYCVHGHTHIPAAYCRAGHTYKPVPAGEAGWDLTSADNWVICPGSVGQPRGGKPGCELAILDRKVQSVHPVRLEYDTDTTVRDIRREHLPLQLAERLLRGR